MSISPYLQFHLQGIDDPYEAWDKVEKVFGKHNVIREHQLEIKTMTLSPNVLPGIEYYLSKFKILRIFLEECKIDMKDDRCIYVIISKLGSAYSIFISSFYVTKKSLGDCGG
jgi:hypothetical protein